MTTIEIIEQESAEMDTYRSGPTGYYENLVNHDLGLKPGQTGSFTDRYDRFVVVMATTVGNIIFFQRYTESVLPIAFNAPDSVGKVIPGGLEWETILHWNGFNSNRFQLMIEEIKEELLEELEE